MIRHYFYNMFLQYMKRFSLILLEFFANSNDNNLNHDHVRNIERQLFQKKCIITDDYYNLFPE